MENMSVSTTTSLPVIRVDIYAGIHKALRAFMCDTLNAAACMDAGDEQEVAGVLAQVRQLADFCEAHLHHENTFVHAAMEARRPGSAATATDDHVHHVHACSRLRSLADAVEQAHHAARADTARQLQSYLAVFIGENLTHMNMEEIEHNAVLWATHTDAELRDLHQSIVAALSPEERNVGMRWMMAAFTPAERAALLSEMRAHAPKPAFDAALAVAKAHLDTRNWSKLAAALDIPQALAA